MKNKKLKNLSYVILLIFGLTVISFGFLSDDKSGQKPVRPLNKLNDLQESGKQGDAYRLFVNNINLPMNRTGVIADVDIPPDGSGGKFRGDNIFLFSSGFFLSGYSDGQLWTNASASATLVEDYQRGRVNPGPNDDAQMYVLNSQDPAFGDSWQDWRDAVALGADFYNGDGIEGYDPRDLVGPGGEALNGEWDPWEDRPDLIGDETVWCVYHDGLPQAQRRWDTVPPYGIEIRQTAFAFASAGALGNIIFIRYRFTYVGLGNPNEADEMTDVYFGVWADPDNGDHENDVVGSDVSRDVGFTYDNQTDGVWGNQPPCFMIDFFSGPRAYVPGETFIDVGGVIGEYDPGIDTPLDTAYSVRGQVMGVEEFPGARNEAVSSFVLYINGDPNLNDPDTKEQARNYILGLDRLGVEPDPATFPYGAVLGGVDPSTIDPRFWFSGDPVTDVGWICTINEDVRQMTNTGPFVLKKNEENEIVVAYVVGQGSSPLNSITVARTIDDGAQNIFDGNFLAPVPPPPVQFELATGENFIDIFWETPDQITYINNTPSWDLLFHQYQIWGFQTNSSADLVSGVQNSQLLTTYQINNSIKDLYLEDNNTGGKFLLYPESLAANKLDSTLFADPSTGRIRYRIFIDPFTNTAITKGKPYYFSVIGSAVNNQALRPYPEKGDSMYYLAAEGFTQATENIKVVSSIVADEDSYDPNLLVQSAGHTTGASTGNVGYDVIYKDSLTSSQYEVTFVKDSASTLYSTFWNLENLTTGEIWDDNTSYTYGLANVDEIVTEGFITKIEEQVATMDIVSYEPASAIWYSDFDSASVTGIWYVGTDLPQGAKIPTFNGKIGEYSFAENLRKVELRFGESGVGKAYRYINGYTGIPASNNYTFAHRLTSSDTTGKGIIGNWDETNNRPNGFIDVPFTAWVVDERYGEEHQLAVGIVERRNTSTYPLGNPDGVWDPDTTLRASGEVIVIFDSPYDPNGGHIELTGGDFSTPGGTETVWAGLINGPDMPDDAEGVTEEQRAIFSANWFNTMYVVGLERMDETSFYTDGDVMTIPLSEYPYTDADVYQFTINGTTISEDEQQNLWDKVNVFPNPLYGFNEYTGYLNQSTDEPWVTFSNLPPTDITIKIYSLSGTLIRTISQDDRDEIGSPFLRWDLKNDAELRVGSGMYLAIVSSPKYGDKVLKFAIIMPQKQIQRF